MYLRAMPASSWLPRDWTSKSAWLEAAHQAARIMRRDLAHATPQQIRHAIELASRLNPGPMGGEFEVVNHGFWSGAEVTWKERNEGTVVWIHGGAFAFGSPRVYRAAATHLARETRCRVLLIDYRLAPENTYPSAHEDVANALSGLFKEGELVVVGDSAGGNLAASVCQQLRQEQEASSLRGLALLSPWCDLRPVAESVVQNRVSHSPFDERDALEYAEAYLAGHPPEDPAVSPRLIQDYSRWPRTYVEWAGDEFLAPDIAQWVADMENRGVKVTSRIEHSAVHGWQLLPDLLPEAKRSMAALGSWAREALGLPPVVKSIGRGMGRHSR